MRLVDRVAYINHDIDDAVRAGVLAAGDLPAGPIEILGATGERRIDTLVHDLVEHSEAAGDIVQGELVGGAMAELRAFMFDRVYLGPVATREHAKINVVIGPVRPLLRAPGRDPVLDSRRRAGDAGDRLPRRDDRPVLHPDVRAAQRSGLVRAVSRYTADSRDRVLDAVDMCALVSARTELRRAGVNSYFGRCPFHDERTGSFHVRPDEKLYHCFGCQASGDPFDFVMQTEGLDFKGALETLAGRFGVQLETEDEDPEAAARRQRRERLHSLLDRAATYYSRYLWEAGEAAGRPRVPARARAGGADPARVPGRLRAERLGPDPARLPAGRVHRRGAAGGRTGAAVARTGRAASTTASGSGSCSRRSMPGGASTGSAPAGCARTSTARKYLNTSDGELYHKREVLFGIDLARAAAAQAGRMILVEGYTDVLALHQAGMRNSVGIMGTSLTEEQVAELERVVKVLELCLDADRAGQDAMLRAARVAARALAGAARGAAAGGTGSRGPDRARGRGGAADPGGGLGAVRRLQRAADPRPRGHPQRRGQVTGRWASCGRCSTSWAPACCATSWCAGSPGRLELSEARAGHPAGTGGSAGGAPAGGTAPARRSASRGDRRDRRPEPRGAFRAPVPRPVHRASRARGQAAGRGRPRRAADQRARCGEAARHLAGRAAAPLADLPADDEELARTISGLVDLAGRVPDPSPDRLEHVRLVLELERLDRAIIRARAEGAGTSELAHDREGVREEMRAVVAKLEKTL